MSMELGCQCVLPKCLICFSYFSTNVLCFFSFSSSVSSEESVLTFTMLYRGQTVAEMEIINLLMYRLCDEQTAVYTISVNNNVPLVYGILKMMLNSRPMKKFCIF